MKKYILPFLSLFLLVIGCKDLETINPNNPDRDKILASGTDLYPVLQGGYIAWWQGVHGDHPAIALGVAADAYGLPLRDFGAQRMGAEPRNAYNNRSNEDPDYKQIAEAPWFGCLSAVSSANDVLLALENDISIDNGGPQDKAIRAAAHFLRGVSWGYLGLIFDKGLIAETETDLVQPIPFSGYQEMTERAVAELNAAIQIAELVDFDFIHNYFNGLTLNADEFVQLCHAYAARFLAQMPRTPAESDDVNWQLVLEHAGQGLPYDFAPRADGRFWMSYQKFVFAETGQGPFWARVDQRLVAALDPTQPPRYPEVQARGEAPLANKMATSSDARLAADFVFLSNINFPASSGEWHFSHYKHNRNISNPEFAGDGFSTGPMPVFLAADNALLRAEALLRLNRKNEAIAIVNAGTRTTRGNLSNLNNNASTEAVAQAIRYERAIELLSTAPMGLWFDRRRSSERLAYTELDALGGLQIGTPAHLPVPARELDIRQAAVYSFGGPNDPEGIVPTF